MNEYKNEVEGVGHSCSYQYQGFSEDICKPEGTTTKRQCQKEGESPVRKSTKETEDSTDDKNDLKTRHQRSGQCDKENLLTVGVFYVTKYVAYIALNSCLFACVDTCCSHFYL